MFKKKFVYIEFNFNGHPQYYLQYLLRSAARNKVKLDIYIYKKKFDKKLLLQLKKKGHTIKDLNKFCNKENKIGVLNKLVYLHKIFINYKTFKTIFIIPMLDEFIYFLNLYNKNIKIRGILFRPYNFYGIKKDITSFFKNLIKLFFFKYLIRDNLKIFSFDKNFSFNHKFTHIKDFIPDFCHYKNFHKKRRNTNILKYGVFGSNLERKGAYNILRAINLLTKNQLKNKFFYFVGTIKSKNFNDEYKYIISKKGYLKKKIIIVNKYLKNYQFYQFFNDMNYTFLTYNKHLGSSSFQVASAFLQKPIICFDEGLIGYENKLYKLGLNVKTNNIQDLKEKILKISTFRFNKKKLKKYIINRNLEKNFDLLLQ